MNNAVYMFDRKYIIYSYFLKHREVQLRTRMATEYRTSIYTSVCNRCRTSAFVRTDYRCARGRFTTSPRTVAVPNQNFISCSGRLNAGWHDKMITAIL